MVVLFPKPVLLVTHSVRMPRDYISGLLRARGYPTIWVRPFMGQPLPSPDPETFSGAVFYGGPQLLTEIDADPFLQDEINWVRAFVEGGGRYLGLCLGGQILAKAFGGDVYDHKDDVHERGYYRLDPTPAGVEAGLFSKNSMQVYHWHRQGIQLPDGVRSFAASEHFPNQAFKITDIALGTQFHPEITDAMIETWTTLAEPDPAPIPGARCRSSHRRDFAEHHSEVQLWAKAMLDDLGFRSHTTAASAAG
ncbi:MAG: glutamine amidotransferase-related protein [Alphaproteobacteria bacterium]